MWTTYENPYCYYFLNNKLLTIAAVMIAETMSLGILALPSAVAALGLVP